MNPNTKKLGFQLQHPTQTLAKLSLVWNWLLQNKRNYYRFACTSNPTMAFTYLCFKLKFILILAAKHKTIDLKQQITKSQQWYSKEVEKAISVPIVYGN
jgi:hypothetical protein